MTHTCRRLKFVMKSALLFGMTLLFVRPSAAQQDFQVIVTGPWSYIHQGARLYLVAPGRSSHGVYIYSGVDPSRWTSLTSLPMPDTHTIDFIPGTYQQGTRPGGPLAKSAVCAGGTPGNIQTVIDNTGSPKNFVISLPYPNKFSTFEDSTYVWDGYSESKVDLTNPVDGSTLPALYTTTMVLHYWAKNVPTQVNLDGTPTSTSWPLGSTPLGITIAAADRAGNVCNNVCDNVSLMSVNERNTLFQIHQHASFPSVLDMVGHQSHHYNRSCSPTSVSKTAEDIEKASEGDKNVNPFCATANGSADCHTCQMSNVVNGVASVPDPTP
jgi:hypothetical protein